MTCSGTTLQSKQNIQFTKYNMNDMRKLLILLIASALPLMAFAQNANVSGKVTADGGEPVVGAVVHYDGADVSTITDLNGNFTIRQIPGKELLISCLGYKEKSVMVTDRTSGLDVKLVEDATDLDEAIIIGYGESSKKDLTEAISSVRADEIRKAGQVDVLGALQGHVAGLNITSQTGEPGSGYNINIRGVNSINAATTPLFVIDGIQMDMSESDGAASLLGAGSNDPLAFLNPADIQSIEVLKDASATAIYGSRGANGVILVTTKSGLKDPGKTTVTYDARFQLTTRMKEREPEMLGADEWIAYRFERNEQQSSADKKFWGYDSNGDGILDTPKTHQDVGRDEVIWPDQMLRNAFLHQHNLSLRSNVGKDTQILAGLGYLGQQGLIVNNDYSKFTANIKVDHSPNKKVKLGMSANYARMKSTGAASSTGGSFSNFGLTQLIFVERPMAYLEDPSDAESSYTSQTSILDCVTGETSRTGITDKVLGNAYFTWKIIPTLTFRAFASGTFSASSDNEFFTNKTRWGHKSNGLAQIVNNKSLNYTANTTLTYRNRWQKAHSLEAMIGVEMNGYDYDYYNQQATNFEDITMRENCLAMGTLRTPVQQQYQVRRMSMFGRINYNYKYRYFVTLNMRGDGSSRFTAGNRVGYFPSMSLAWVLSNEKWARSAKNSWLDNAKLRASIGASGNDRISNYANLSTVDKLFYSNAEGQQVTGMAEYVSGNPKLKWETTYQYDLGLDLGLFNGRVDFTFDAYYKDTRDMLFKAVLPSQTGFTTQWQNIGNVINKGLEFTLNTVNVKQGDFSWSSNLTMDLNRNRVTSLGEGVEYLANPVSKGAFTEEPTRLIAGEPLGIIWGYEWDGNYQLDDFNIYYKNTDIPVAPELVTSENYQQMDFELKEGVTKMNGVSVKPGDRKFKDLDGDGVVKEDTDKKIIGNSYPLFSYGFGNTFNWRGFSLYVFFDGVYGRDILNEFKYRTESGASTAMYNIRSTAYHNAWRPENGSNSYARLNNQTNCQNVISSFYVEDGSYLRLRTISLSYSLPSKACQAIRFQSLKFTLSAENVAIFSKYSGLDPDISTSNVTFPGLDRMGYPTGRSFSLGIIANF